MDVMVNVTEIPATSVTRFAQFGVHQNLTANIIRYTVFYDFFRFRNVPYAVIATCRPAPRVLMMVMAVETVFITLVIHSRENKHVHYKERAADGDCDAERRRVRSKTVFLLRRRHRSARWRSSIVADDGVQRLEPSHGEETVVSVVGAQLVQIEFPGDSALFAWNEKKRLDEGFCSSQSKEAKTHQWLRSRFLFRLSSAVACLLSLCCGRGNVRHLRFRDLLQVRDETEAHPLLRVDGDPERDSAKRKVDELGNDFSP